MRSSPAEERVRQEQERLNERAMHVLTGGLTAQGEAFLVAVGAVLLTGVLYPLIEGWAFLAFPTIFAAATIATHFRRSA